jgi:hypothetical protein
LSDVSEWAGPTRRVLVRSIVLSVTGDRADGWSAKEPTVDSNK